MRKGKTMKSYEVLILVLAAGVMCIMAFMLGLRVNTAQREQAVQPAQACVYDPNTPTLQEINWPIHPKWLEAYGDSPQSQRDYDIWLIGQRVKNMDSRLKVLEDPNSE